MFTSITWLSVNSLSVFRLIFWVSVNTFSNKWVLNSLFDFFECLPNSLVLMKWFSLFLLTIHWYSTSSDSNTKSLLDFWLQIQDFRELDENNRNLCNKWRINWFSFFNSSKTSFTSIERPFSLIADPIPSELRWRPVSKGCSLHSESSSELMCCSSICCLKSWKELVSNLQ